MTFHAQREIVLEALHAWYSIGAVTRESNLPLVFYRSDERYAAVTSQDADTRDIDLSLDQFRPYRTLKLRICGASGFLVH